MLKYVKKAESNGSIHFAWNLLKLHVFEDFIFYIFAFFEWTYTSGTTKETAHRNSYELSLVHGWVPDALCVCQGDLSKSASENAIAVGEPVKRNVSFWWRDWSKPTPRLHCYVVRVHLWPCGFLLNLSLRATSKAWCDTCFQFETCVTPN